VHAERIAKPVCQVIRTDGAAILQKCDGQLRSFALSMNGTERTAVREHTNKFRFVCRPGFCRDEPEISGWFIDSDVWTQSEKDEPSIFSIVAAQAGWKLLGSEEHFRSIFRPSCELSRVTVAGLPGKMICYNTNAAVAERPATIVIAAADEQVGVLIVLQSSDKNIADQAASILKTFSLERGEGDAALQRWLQR
jgi:hypothetical protein